LAGRPGPTETHDPKQFIEAADKLLAEGDFSAARQMNEQAGEQASTDAELGVLVARQKGQIERQAALAEARVLMANGNLEQAGHTLAKALEHSPSDPEISALLSELAQKGASSEAGAQVAGALLDSAERALSRNDPTEAANQLRAAEALSLPSPELVARRDRIAQAITLASRVKAARELIAVDPALALERALVLEGEFPGEPSVTRLVTAVRTAVAKKSTPARGRPSPAPEPAARATLVVAGSPVGAHVHVDGTLRGTLPLSIELPAGAHEVSVSADGHSPRKTSVELTQGGTQQLELALKPTTSKAPDGLLSPFKAGESADPGLQDPFGRNP
jgi:tetratricopeptide (TPR) repeat protein